MRHAGWHLCGTIAALLAALSLAVAAGPAAADSPAPRGPTEAEGAEVEPAASVVRNRVLRSTAVLSGNGLGGVPAGFQPLHDPEYVICPRDTAGACTIVAEPHVQVSNNQTGNRWAICTQVDGVWMTQPTCPWLGVLPTGGEYHTGGFIQSQSGIPRGRRTVQTFVYSDSGMSVSIWGLAYKVYKPN